MENKINLYFNATLKTTKQEIVKVFFEERNLLGLKSISFFAFIGAFPACQKAWKKGIPRH